MINTCTICGCEKEISEFLQDKQASKGYRNQCKLCLRERYKLIWNKRREGYNEAMRKYRSTNKGAIMTSITAAKQRSKKQGIPFDLDLEYVTNLFDKQKGLCAITGEVMVPKSKDRMSPSLDKINPSKGYVKGNVQWLTWKANMIKQDLNMEELRDFCTKVLQLSC